MRCEARPLLSIAEATREIEPITIVARAIKGVEKSTERRKLILRSRS
jgi:hypothetical protein